MELNYLDEARDILFYKGIIRVNANKILFSLSTIGLLCGENNLQGFVDAYIEKDDINTFKREALKLNKGFLYVDLYEEVIDFIPDEIKLKDLSRITEIILKCDLRKIVLTLTIWDESTKGEYAISSTTYLNELVLNIFKLYKGDTLYNIGCGTGEFLIKAADCNLIKKAKGQTFYKEEYLISYIRSRFLNSGINIEINNESFFTYNYDEKFDMVYGTYPFMLDYKFNKDIPIIENWQLDFVLNKKYTSNALWLINSMQLINEKGIAIVVVPNGVLVNWADENIRRCLIDNNWLDTIINLPNNFFPHTGIATSLVILRKNRENSLVRMIDASNIFTSLRRINIFSDEDINYIMDIYQKSVEFPNDVTTTNEVIKNNNYNLSTSKYLVSDELINGIKLGDVTLKVFRGHQMNAKKLDDISNNINTELKYRLINISDIHLAGFINEDLQLINPDEIRKIDKYCVQKGDIVITAKNTTIKSAVYQGNNDYKDIIASNLIVIRVDQTKIDPYYLKAFLDSEIGEKAIKSIQTGTTIASINPGSLEEMRISLLPMEQQMNIAKEYKESILLIQSLLKEVDKTTNHMKTIYQNFIKN